MATAVLSGEGVERFRARCYNNGTSKARCLFTSHGRRGLLKGL